MEDVVEDIVLMAIKDSSFEPPLLLHTVDLEDLVWEEYSSSEIRKNLPQLPLEQLPVTTMKLNAIRFWLSPKIVLSATFEV